MSNGDELLPGEEEFKRNLIGGRWVFPSAPYEFEIRSPLDSSVIAVVPLSSRFDVARAANAATAAGPAWAAEPVERHRLLTRLVSAIDELAEPLSGLQATETGIALTDSERSVRALAAFGRRLLVSPGAGEGTRPGVSAHVLSWGLPLAEIVCAVLPHLLVGRTVVVKPSLRAPLSAVAVAHLATRLGLPPGVVNLVQGTGLDVAAALFGIPKLAALHVRPNERTLTAAARAAEGVPFCPLRASGNLAIAGPEADPDEVAATVVDALRLHSAGGPLSLPLLAVHRSLADSVAEAVLARLEARHPAPLPTEGLRQQALKCASSVGTQPARVLHGQALPDDAEHRMGWVMPPTLVATNGPLTGSTDEPIGPVLAIATWQHPEEIRAGLEHPRYADGIACVFGLDRKDLPARLPQPTVVDGAGPMTALSKGELPPGWTGGLPSAKWYRRFARRPIERGGMRTPSS